MNNVLFNTSGSLALAVNYEIQGPYRDKFLTKQADKTIRINAEVFIRVNQAIFNIDTDIDLGEADLDQGSSFEVSQTYYIYACYPQSGNSPVFKISKNSTYPYHPEGFWNAQNTRKIGGFNTDSSGNIIESSIWDLRTIDITISGVTDDMIPADEISWSKLKSSTFPFSYKTSITLEGQDGVTINHNKGDTDYIVKVSVKNQSLLGMVGEIVVQKAANTCTIFNSGISGIDADIEISTL